MVEGLVTAAVQKEGVTAWGLSSSFGIRGSVRLVTGSAVLTLSTVPHLVCSKAGIISTEGDRDLTIKSDFRAHPENSAGCDAYP
jgi:hypothetical protein